MRLHLYKNHDNSHPMTQMSIFYNAFERRMERTQHVQKREKIIYNLGHKENLSINIESLMPLGTFVYFYSPFITSFLFIRSILYECLISLQTGINKKNPKVFSLSSNIFLYILKSSTYSIHKDDEETRGDEQKKKTNRDPKLLGMQK